jgi:hypothetical protein
VKSWLSDMMDPASKARIKDKLSEVQCPTDSISDGKSLVEDLDTLLDLQEGVSRWLYNDMYIMFDVRVHACHLPPTATEI